MPKGQLSDQWRKSYAAGRDGYERELIGQGERTAFITLIVIILLGSLLFELLAHYTRWPFAARIGLTVVAISLAQYFASRFFNRARPKS